MQPIRPQGTGANPGTQSRAVRSQNLDDIGRISQSFREQKHLDTFFRSNKLLKNIEDTANQYVTTYQKTKQAEDALAAVIVRLSISYQDLLKHNIDLLHLVVEEPLQFIDATKYTVYSIIRDFVKQRSNDSGLKAIDIDQVHVLLRFIDLPCQESLFFDPSKSLYPTGLSQLLGILSAITEPDKLVLQSVWFCATGCNRNKIKSETEDAPSCISCTRQMREYTKLRKTQNCILLRVLPVASVQTPRTLNKIFRAVTVRLKGKSHLQLRALTGHTLSNHRLLRLPFLLARIRSMESNRVLNSDLSALDDLSEADLDEMLQFDDCPALNFSRTKSVQRSNQEDVMAYNRQPLSLLNSQQALPRLGDYPAESQQLNLTLNFGTQKSESLEMFTPNVSVIELDNSENNSIRIPSPSEADSKASSRNNKIASGSNKIVKKTLEEQLACLDDDEFGLPPLDFDFEELDEIERTHASQQKPTTSKFNTQMEVSRMEVQPEAVSISCPIPRKVSRGSESADPPTPILSPASGHNEPANILALEFGSSSSARASLPSSAANTQPSNSSRCEPRRKRGISPILPPSPIALLRFPDHELSTNAVFAMPKEDTTETSNADSRSFDAFAPDPTMVPASVKQLHDVIKDQYSDFAFVYALSAQLCQNRVPMDCFINLKMGLLLSLASIGPHPDRPPIPVIAIGSDTYMTEYLLSHIGQLAARFIGPIDDTKPPSSAGYRNHNWIEADPIVLAKGGVFYVGDWSRLKVARADKLFKDIECSRVTMEKSTLTYPLQTAIWAHWRSFKYNAKDQQMFNKFVKIFGIPLYVEDDNHEGLISYMLEQASVQLFESTVDHLSISEDDMRTFLDVVSKRTVDLTPAANSLLQRYFVASRAARPDCLTQQAFVVLRQFAESFARLSMRHEVVTIDAVAAIFMCENFIQNIFGASENPPPPFESHNFVGTVDAHLKQFNEWLESYIERFYNRD